MVKQVRDTLHGFGMRPHYEPAELDRMFEKIVCDFLNKKYATVSFPFTTEDITTLIEQDVSDLDLYADLSCYGVGVEGVTEFSQVGKPRVSISEKAHEIENRLRTTLTHEYGHVVLHNYLFVLEERQMNMTHGQKANAIYCKRDTMMPSGRTDWMEWQAGYVCGAMLMPKTHLVRSITPILEENNSFGPVAANSGLGETLISNVVNGFGVSREAARVRLTVLGHLGTAPAIRSLFS